MRSALTGMKTPCNSMAARAWALQRTAAHSGSTTRRIRVTRRTLLRLGTLSLTSTVISAGSTVSFSESEPGGIPQPGRVLHRHAGRRRGDDSCCSRPIATAGTASFRLEGRRCWPAHDNVAINGALKPIPVLTGDYNGDGVVDAADYTVWRDRLRPDRASTCPPTATAAARSTRATTTSGCCTSASKAPVAERAIQRRRARAGDVWLCCNWTVGTWHACGRI